MISFSSQTHCFPFWLVELGPLPLTVKSVATFVSQEQHQVTSRLCPQQYFCDRENMSFAVTAKGK